MEYIYAALLLSKLGKEVNEHNVKKVLEATGIHPEEARIKALVSALQGVDIEKEVKEAATATFQPAAVAATEAPKEHHKEKPKEDEKKSEEAAAAGLGALFG